MAMIRPRRASAARQPRTNCLTLFVCLCVGINLYLFLGPPGHGQTSTGGGVGEGAHRHRQTELAGAADAGQQQDAQDSASAQAQTADAASAAATAEAAGDAGLSSGGDGGGGSGDSCHIELDAEYSGEDVVAWGEQNLQDSPDACCAACQAKAPKCNVWVYCAAPDGCRNGRIQRECWLKNKHDLDPLKPQGQRGPGTGWVSGAVYTQAEYDAAMQHMAALKAGEQQYLDELRGNQTLPMVFLDVEIKGKRVGRIEMVLFTHISPRSAENFRQLRAGDPGVCVAWLPARAAATRQLCTGESGVVPPGREGAGLKRHLKGHPFYRIIDQFIDQAGVEVESVFGGQFKDDPGGLKLKHEHKGLLSMANMGHDTNTAHFSIMMGPAQHLNGDYTIFGQVVSGFEVMDAINALSEGKPDNTATAADGVMIVDSGQLRKGTIVPDLTLGL